jgi:hypothetical protein
MLYIIALVGIALIANYAIRLYVRKVDGSGPRASDDDDSLRGKFPPSPGDPSVEEIKRAWGRVRDKPISIKQPIHPEIRSILEIYEYIGPDAHFRPIDSALNREPYECNQNFIQIGAWGDGSEVLAKIDALDSNIYIADIESTSPDSPTVAADTMDQFLAMAWRYYKDSLNT